MNWDSAMTMSPEAMMELMLGMGTAGLVWMIVITIVLSLPPVFVLFSRRASGGAKFGWFILTSLFSWLAYAVFLIITRPPAKNGAGQDGAARK